ncbi:hypothetical protein KTD22_13565 [Burkholderia multivorans]|uniref:HEPN domain-containing protein n=1 Tax=Burkholderia multivorans TaxID=87883 RepID=UPI001C2152F0|nr:HEPN domain-containing protein [Burkholderia multivorans]MBU9227653.1 hypothetical protein [Burkholderia multivorans]
MVEPKLLRTLKRTSDEFFTKKSFFIPASLKDIPSENFFSHQFRLPGNRWVFMTESGYEKFRRIVELIDRAAVFDGLADFSDIWEAWLSIATKYLSDGVQPDDGEELLRNITSSVNGKIEEHTFAVPLYGVKLDSDGPFQLGSATIFKMAPEALGELGIEHAHIDVAKLLKKSTTDVFLKSTIRSTRRVAERKFAQLAATTTGVLAIAAASMYQHGSSRFRIGVAMASDAAVDTSIWFSWTESGRSLSTHYRYPSGQPFPLNASLGTTSDLTRMVYRAQSLAEGVEQTEVAIAVSKAIFWYSDAQRDAVPVMKFVKFWSCVEVFFSFDGDKITESVSSGLASLLVFGGFQFQSVSQYFELRAEIKRLYGLRSRAVHGASHDHISDGTIARFSQLVAWMLLTVVSLSERGYTTLAQVRTQVDRLDGIATRGAAKSDAA